MGKKYKNYNSNKSSAKVSTNQKNIKTEERIANKQVLEINKNLNPESETDNLEDLTKNLFDSEESPLKKHIKNDQTHESSLPKKEAKFEGESSKSFDYSCTDDLIDAANDIIIKDLSLNNSSNKSVNEERGEEKEEIEKQRYLENADQKVDQKTNSSNTTITVSTLSSSIENLSKKQLSENMNEEIENIELQKNKEEDTSNNDYKKTDPETPFSNKSASDNIIINKNTILSVDNLYDSADNVAASKNLSEEISSMPIQTANNNMLKESSEENNELKKEKIEKTEKEKINKQEIVDNSYEIDSDSNSLIQSNKKTLCKKISNETEYVIVDEGAGIANTTNSYFLSYNNAENTTNSSAIEDSGKMDFTAFDNIILTNTNSNTLFLNTDSERERSRLFPLEEIILRQTNNRRSKLENQLWYTKHMSIERKRKTLIEKLTQKVFEEMRNNEDGSSPKAKSSSFCLLLPYIEKCSTDNLIDIIDELSLIALFILQELQFSMENLEILESEIKTLHEKAEECTKYAIDKGKTVGFFHSGNQINAPPLPKPKEAHTTPQDTALNNTIDPKPKKTGLVNYISTFATKIFSSSEQ